MTSEETVRELVRSAVEARLGVPGAARSGPGEQPPGARAGAPSPAGRASGPDGAIAIAIGADHGGFALKEQIGRHLREQGFATHDCGTHGPEPVDYPDFAHVVAQSVAGGACRYGIIVDGAGIGSCMVANKVPGVRAAQCHDVSSARNSREHNHANVLTLGGRFLGDALAMEIVDTWLATPWGPGRHAARVEKITQIERHYLRDPGA